MPIDLAGKPILITGASSGIGRATALACARAGMPVAIAARRLERLEDLARTIRTSGGRAVAVACDVAREEDCRRAVGETLDAFGSMYAVFANAGLAYENTVEGTSEAQAREIFEINFWGSYRFAMLALPIMRKAGHGHILFCSSCLAKIGMPYFASYSATKAAQDHYCRALRHELAGTNIHASSVHPIGTRTELFEQAGRRSPSPRLALRTSDRFMQPPERVANAVVKCLRRPKGEVWTSWPMRTALGLGMIAPGVTDRLMGWALRRRLSAS